MSIGRLSYFTSLFASHPSLKRLLSFSKSINESSQPSDHQEQSHLPQDVMLTVMTTNTLGALESGDVSIYRIGGGPQAPRSALPIGADPVADPTRLVAVNINRDLLHQVLAVSYAKESDHIISSNIAGFIYVTDIDIQRKKITYLAPCAGELPSKHLIVGSLTWLEG